MLTSIGTPIDRVGSRGLGVTRRNETEGNLATDKGGDQAQMIFGGVEGAEYDTD